MNELKAKLGFKGERGYSAYEIAVQNGYEGTEQDWLATLGTSSHLAQDISKYTSTEGQTEFDLPTNYTSDCFVDVYVNGSKLTSDQYSISDNKVVLATGLEAGKTVEVIQMTMSTNSLPIVTSVDSESTDDTVLSAKGSYIMKQSIENNSSQIEDINDDVESLDIKTDSTNDVIGLGTDTYSNILTYAIGDLVIYNNKIYKCNTEILIPEEFNISKWDTISIVDNEKINSSLLSKWKRLGSASGSNIITLPEKFEELFIAVKSNRVTRNVYLAQTIIPYVFLSDELFEINIGGRLTLSNQGCGVIGQISKSSYQTTAVYVTASQISEYETVIYYR